MRKLIVSNFVTLDGLYEGKDKSIHSLYDYYHADYADDHSFDFYNAERLHAARRYRSNSFLPALGKVRATCWPVMQSAQEIILMDEPKLYTLEEAHLHFAKTLNGKVWELLQKTERSKVEEELMVHAAHASCYHWLMAGTGLHHQRAEWLIAHVHTELGQTDSALRHALRCFDLTREFADLMKDFDLAYAYEAVARANALAGNRDEAARYLQLARESGQAIGDAEDKSTFLGDLDGGNWHGFQ